MCNVDNYQASGTSNGYEITDQSREQLYEIYQKIRESRPRDNWINEITQGMERRGMKDKEQEERKAEGSELKSELRAHEDAICNVDLSNCSYYHIMYFVTAKC